jgi:exopolyphosphatase/guanosine-5'-triphosphate,3'-diphosphate pyrophosphatase
MDINAPVFTVSQYQALVAARSLGRTCGYEASHASQVTRLALRLFSELSSLHQLDSTGRYYLVCAGILHDIGWVEGGKNHHKTGLDIILNSALLPLNNRERLIIGSVVRYHYAALPSPKHDHFAALQPADQQIVLYLAALLRLADGLDRPHHLLVRDLRCEVNEGDINLSYFAPSRAKAEEKAAREKSDLLEQVYERHLSIKWLSPSHV